MATYSAPRGDASFREAQRLIVRHLPGATLLADGAPGALLELFAPSAEPPHTARAALLEGAMLHARPVPARGIEPFAAFLDGIQRSRVVHYLPGGTPVVHGTVAAIVRMRANRRLSTWRHRIARRLFMPRSLVPAALWHAAEEAGMAVDTSPPGESDARGAADRDAPAAGRDSPHPFVLLDQAYHRVQAAREALEQELAAEWCAAEGGALFVDGGISGSERVAASAQAAGVVKSHRTLYAQGDALRTVLALRAGERTSAFRILSARRAPVASWYLRLRDPASHDPLWGLVRIEIAERPGPALGAAADDVSRRVLAEVSPLALPDARWDKLVYAVRDCEETLRASL